MIPQEEKLVLAKINIGQNSLVSGLIRLMGFTRAARIKSLITYLFPSPKFMRQRYRVRSNLVLPLYYPYRWWSMSRKIIAELRFKACGLISYLRSDVSLLIR